MAGAGKDWVRNHPLMVSALVVQDTHLDVYTSTGLNLLLGWESQDAIYQAAVLQNLPWTLHAIHKRTPANYPGEPNPGPLIDADVAADKQRTIDYINQYPGNVALYVWDEPKPDDYTRLLDAVSWAKTSFPSKLTYTSVNAYDTMSGGCGGNPGIGYDYSDHVTNVIGTGLDVISANPYPYYSDTTQTETYLRCRYFATLESVRNRAKSADVPYWIFVQSTDEKSYRLPSQSDLRLTLFAPLAYGFTGFHFYMYWHPDSDNIVQSTRQFPSPPDAGHAFNHHVEDAVAEVARLGRTLRLLKSQLVRHVRSQSANTLPWGTVEFEGTPVNPLGGITGITMTTAAATDNGLIGFFEDDYHHNYFMLVNTKRAAGTGASDTSLTFNVDIGPTITSLYKMNRDTGVIESVPIAVDPNSNKRTVTVTILGGTGELFKVNSPSFVGL